LKPLKTESFTLLPRRNDGPAALAFPRSPLRNNGNAPPLIPPLLAKQFLTFA
jgi:hypothetical protein